MTERPSVPFFAIAYGISTFMVLSLALVGFQSAQAGDLYQDRMGGAADVLSYRLSPVDALADCERLLMESQTFTVSESLMYADPFLSRMLGPGADSASDDERAKRLHQIADLSEVSLQSVLEFVTALRGFQNPYSGSTDKILSLTQKFRQLDQQIQDSALDVDRMVSLYMSLREAKIEYQELMDQFGPMTKARAILTAFRQDRTLQNEFLKVRKQLEGASGLARPLGSRYGVSGRIDTLLDVVLEFESIAYGAAAEAASRTILSFETSLAELSRANAAAVSSTDPNAIQARPIKAPSWDVEPQVEDFSFGSSGGRPASRLQRFLKGLK